jgi:hypothetical protein
MSEAELKPKEEGDTKIETIHDFNYEVQYEKIATGKGNSVALINKPPFLLTWGYGHDKAWGFPRIFKDDKPVQFQTVGALLYVMTQKGNFYKIDCEKKEYNLVEEKSQKLEEE